MSTIAGEPADLNAADLRYRAVAAARGDEPFDVLISGGQLVDMVTGEIRHVDIGIVGPLIASVHASATRSDAKTVLDAKGGYICPGLIDTHMHVESSMVTPAVYAGAVLPRGVTSVVWDPHELGNVNGVAGVDWAIDAVHDLALRFFVLAPSCVPSAPGYELSGADFDAETISDILARPEIAGLAEVMNMRGVIANDPRMGGIVNAALRSGKLVCGHARGLGGAELAAFATAGIGSDHELISGEDLMEKLRAGFAIELRGSHDHLLPELVEALNRLGHLPQTVTLCTDDIFPDDLADAGGLNDVVRRLVRYGLDPVWALRAATLNAAQRLGRTDLGLIAPGRRADVVVFEDLTDFAARHVMANGTPVAHQGSLYASPSQNDIGPLTGSMLCGPTAPEDFATPATGDNALIATIDVPRFTRWGEREADVADGVVVPPDDTTLIAVMHRHGRAEARPRTGFLTGWGKWRGAFCTSVSHDSHNLTVFGQDPKDMSRAANAVIAAGGGMAVASEGDIKALLELPAAGLLSDASLTEVAHGFAGVRRAMDDIVGWQPPYLVFKACFGATLACNAGPHQTDQGIADVDFGRLLASPVLQTDQA